MSERVLITECLATMLRHNERAQRMQHKWRAKKPRLVRRVSLNLIFLQT